MASELSRLIEDELSKKGFYSGPAKGAPPPREEERDDEEAPGAHQALMGALRVEARVKEHQHTKKLLTLKRIICVGGGLLVVIILWAVLAVKSKTAAKAAQGAILMGGPSTPTLMTPFAPPTAADGSAPPLPAGVPADAAAVPSPESQPAADASPAPESSPPLLAADSTPTNSTGDAASEEGEGEDDYEGLEADYEEEVEEYEAAIEEYEKEYEEAEQELEAEEEAEVEEEAELGRRLA